MNAVTEQDSAWADNEEETRSKPTAASGRLLEWFEEIAPQSELEAVLREYLPDFHRNALADPQQWILINQRLSSFGPVLTL
jgi:hypothetical protein